MEIVARMFKLGRESWLKKSKSAMKTKTNKTKIVENKSGAEKPVSLWGASLTDVLAALLKTKPMPKGANNQKDKSK